MACDQTRRSGGLGGVTELLSRRLQIVCYLSLNFKGVCSLIGIDVDLLKVLILSNPEHATNTV